MGRNEGLLAFALITFFVCVFVLLGMSVGVDMTRTEAISHGVAEWRCDPGRVSGNSRG